jgi:hypothetical protein
MTAPDTVVARREAPFAELEAARDCSRARSRFWWRTIADAPGADRLILVSAVGAFLLYAALFIYRTSFVVDGERYFSLFDDAMVSMRYAKNLAEGHGLVWNPGERVEGYTNPLWVVYMALIHLFPLPPSKTSLVVQITAAVCLAVNLYFVRRLALAVSNGSSMVALGALALTASYLPINNWSLQGMEVGALVLLVTVCASLAIAMTETGTFRPALYVLLGFGTLLRPDMVVPFAAFLSFLLIADPANRRNHLAWGALVLGIMVGAQTAFRFWYYGDILPNTYYLKMTGVPLAVRMGRGAYVLLQFVWNANPLLFLLVGAVALRRDSRIRLLFWLFTTQVAYSVWVGGDAWEYWGGSNRYISIVMPLFFVLLSCALYRGAEALLHVVGSGIPAAIPARTRAVAFAAGLAYSVLVLNSLRGTESLAEALLIRPPLHAGEGGQNQQEVRESLLLRRATAPDARLAVFRAGTIPYFTGRYSIDMLGKTDAHVARAAAAAVTDSDAFLGFRPGHVKWDYAYSVGRQQPDVILHMYSARADLAGRHLQGYDDAMLEGRCAYVRRASPRIVWDELTRVPCD